MPTYNVPIVVLRETEAGETRHDTKAIVDGTVLYLPVDADIEQGDRVEQRLPNGKLRTLYVTRVDVLQSPFGSSNLDHTEAQYTTKPPQPAGRSGGATFNVNATSVQVATGDRSQQTMTVGQTAEQVALVMEGVVEVLRALGLSEGRDDELAAVQQAAVADLKGDRPSADGVRRFYDWVLDCVKKGGTTAAVAAVTAASSGLLHDAEALVGAVSG